ncbi:MAG: site-2 protease family protein [Desulfovibrionaceae bacterium]|nr:site-2 protease family protein [Desulfovibrionaceae bacterium]
MPDLNIALLIKKIAISFVPLMLGLVIHEYAHGWMAKRCGDDTASSLGRLTLNPLPHIDPMGMIFFILTSLSGPFVFGWAKPVPINPRRFHRLKRDFALVAAAGPVSNLLLALLSACVLKGYLLLMPAQAWHTSSTWQFGMLSLYTSITVNCALAWFNLIPIPPLDGSKILWTILPGHMGLRYLQLERYGTLLILLLLLGPVSAVIAAPIRLTIHFLLNLFAL